VSDSTSFFANWFVWRDALVVSLLSAAVLGYLGVWVVLKRVIYVPLALAQVSSVGVVTAFFVADVLQSRGATAATDWHAIVNPAAVSLAFAVLASLFFARPGRSSDEPVVLAYLVGSAVALLLGGFVRQDFHDLQSVLFGSAVLVETVQIAYVGVAGVLVLGVHALFYRRFLFVSFDPDSAGASAIPLFVTEVLLYGSFAVMISIATRAIGALPAFGFIVLPALTGLGLGRSMRGAFVIAIGVGVGAAALGYYLSWIFELPTGASMVAVAGLGPVVGALGGRWRAGL